MSKIFTKIGLGFLGLVTLLICVSFVLPGETHVSRSTIIKAPANYPYNQVNTLKNWEKWSPWHQMDTAMTLTYEGPASGAGAKYSWISEEMGNGSLAITNTKPNQLIETEMDFGGMGISKAAYTFEPVAEGTKVTWTMDSDGTGVSWYWYVPCKYFGLLMEDMLIADFDKGLKSLKETVEKQPKTETATSNLTISEKNLQSQPVLTIDAVCTQEELPGKLAGIYSELKTYATKHNLQITGAPFAVYHAYDPKKITLEAGLPVNKMAKTDGKIKASAIKPGKVVMAAHYGSYEKTYDAHLKIDDYLKAHKLTQVGSPWETYVTDPMQEKDPAKWLTEIYYPIN